MMPSDKNTPEWIENYLRDQLPPAEAEKVRKRIAEDPAFATEVAWMKSFLDMMEDQSGHAVLDAFHEIRQKREKAAKRRRLIYLAAGATVLLALIVLVAPLLPFMKDSPGTEIATEAPATSPGASWETFVEIAGGQQMLSAGDSLLERALRLVDQKAFTDAIPLLEDYLSALPEGEEDLNRRMLAGKIRLKVTKDFEEAAAHFNHIIENEDALPVFRSEARFHLALTDIARGEEAQGRTALERIAETGMEPWRSKAGQALETIEWKAPEE